MKTLINKTCLPRFLFSVVFFLSASAMAEEPWVELFNGKDLSGWISTERISRVSG